MPILETFALTITTALAKHMLSQWLGNTWQAQVGQDFLDLLRGTAIDRSASKAEVKQVDAIAASIVSQMDPWVKVELRNLGEGERQAALIESARTVALVDAHILAGQRLNGSHLGTTLMAIRPDAAKLLSEPAANLYERIIRESANAIVNEAHALPGYAVAIDAAQLMDHDRILGYSEQILAVLGRQHEELWHIRDMLRRNDDPYADYLTQLFKRINEFLNHAFGITAYDVGLPLQSLSLRFRVIPGLLDSTTEIKLTPDPLVTMIGKRFEETPHTFDELRKALNAFNGRLLLLGEPGAGKTISLLKFALDAVRRRILNPQQPLPILGIVPTWDYDTTPTISDWLKMSFGVPHDVETIIRMGQGLLLLDGLDELIPRGWDARDLQYFFVKQLPPNNQVILTCRTRTIEFLRGQISLAGTVEVQPLSDEQVTDHLLHFPELRSVIHDNNILRELLQTPFFFSLFVETFHDASFQTLADLQVHSNITRTRHAILNRCIQHRYERAASEGDHHIHLSSTFEDLAFCLCDVAYKLVGRSPFEDKSSLSISDFPQEFDKQASEILRDALRLRLIVQLTQTTYRFSHLLFRDYFAFERAKGLIGNLQVEYGSIHSTRGLAYVIHALDSYYRHESPSDSGYMGWFLQECVGNLRSETFTFDQHMNIVDNLIAFGDEAVEVALTLLDDPDRMLKGDAILILTEIDALQMALEPLIQLAKQEHGRIRAVAVEALGNIGGTAAVNTLLDIACSDSDVAFEAAEALINVGTEALEPISNRLASLLDSDIQIVQQALGRDPVEEKANLFLQALDQAPGGVPRLLLAIQSAIVAPNGIARQLAENAISVAFDTDHVLFWLLIQTTRSYPSHAIELLKNESRDVRIHAAQVLHVAESEESIEPLIGTLADPDKEVSFIACKALASFGPVILNNLYLLGFVEAHPFDGEDEEILGRLLAMASEEGRDGPPHAWLHSLITVIAIWCEMTPEYIPVLVEHLDTVDSSQGYVVANSLVVLDHLAVEPLVHAAETGGKTLRSRSMGILEFMDFDVSSLKTDDGPE